jgi:hypothetical protein
MDETEPAGDQPQDFNKIDLSQLQGFSFGTQWTQDKSQDGGGREARPSRGERRGDAGEGAGDRRDRRAFRRPAGPRDAAGGGDRPAPRRDEGRPEPRADRGVPRPRAPLQDRTPYDSPHFAITFYPDDATFDALVKTIRASCRTIELFEIARTILDKPERFTVHVARKEGSPNQGPVHISVPDGMPFESEEAAVAHVLARHFALFFDAVDAEVEPPRGNFLVVNRCGVTGELLAPPNYHRYSQIMQQHHAANLSRMPFEAYRSRIETVRDPELIKQWLEKMKKVTRYVWKSGAPAPVPAAAAQAGAAPAPVEAQAPSEASAQVAQEAPPQAAPAHAPEAQAAKQPTFDSLEDAQAHLLAHARDKVVRQASHARVNGRDGALMPDGEIRNAIEGALERQRRFPLDTANALRGRLRREHFTIFKKGSKGVSYVCAVKRKFRVPGQVFSENIGNLISFIEAHPLVKAGELAKGLLGAESVPDAAAALTPEQREKIARIQGDLHWLVREGYVTEFMDGGLYASAPIPESRKKQAEQEEHDPENFPEAPPQQAPEEPAQAAPEASVSPEVPSGVPPQAPVPAAPAEASQPAPSDPSAPSAP